jgi:TonB family protein
MRLTPAKVPWAWVARGIAATIVISVVLWVRAELSKPSDLPSVQRITLVAPPAPPPPQQPPPPEPELKPQTPQELAPADTTANKFTDQTAPAEPQTRGAGPVAPGGPGPDSNVLGLDTSGEGGADAFGLAGRPGAREITTLGPHYRGGGGEGGGEGGVGQRRLVAKFNGLAYSGKLKTSLEAALNAKTELREHDFRTVFDLWIDPNGLITRIKLVESSGEADLDGRIRAALNALPVAAPPPGMPQPVRIAIGLQKAEAAAGAAAPQ